MTGMMRAMVTSRNALEPYMQVSTQHLVRILAEISKNPSNPRFNHYLFECLAALIRYPNPSLVSFHGLTCQICWTYIS
jgi:exportin-2 (importin alpha re-exporter)